MKNKRVWKDWGVSPIDAMYAFRSHDECPHCRKSHIDLDSVLVGFSCQVLDEDPGEFLYTSYNHHSVVGVLVWRCSKCAGLFWGHADKVSVESLLLFAKEDVGGLKPEIRKQLLKAWEEYDAN